MRYGYDLGCRFGQPHNMMLIHENAQQRWERCLICNRKFRYNKGYKTRVENRQYLKDHVRQYAQKFGATKRIFNKLYRPELMTIKI